MLAELLVKLLQLWRCLLQRDSILYGLCQLPAVPLADFWLAFERVAPTIICSQNIMMMIIIVIMYIYYPLINALSAPMIHINLNMIFYAHVEHSPTKTIYMKYYMEKQIHRHTHTRTHTCTHTHTHTHTHTQIRIHTIQPSFHQLRQRENFIQT